MNNKASNRVVFLLAPSGFRDEEYFQSKVILQARGIEIVTIALGNPEEITGTQGGKARTTQSFESVVTTDFAALVLIGGKGCRQYFEEKSVHELANEFIKEQKVVAAICSAPGILAHADIVKGKKVTSFYEEKELMTSFGGIWEDSRVVTDGKLVTAQSHEDAIAFGEAIVSVL